MECAGTIKGGQNQVRLRYSDLILFYFPVRDSDLVKNSKERDRFVKFLIIDNCINLGLTEPPAQFIDCKQ